MKITFKCAENFRYILFNIKEIQIFSKTSSDLMGNIPNIKMLNSF